MGSEKGQSINKLQAITKMSEEFCDPNSVILLMNAADRLISPYVLKSLNTLYQKNIKIATGRQLFSQGLTFS